MKTFKTFLLLLVVLLFSGTLAFAQIYNETITVYNSGTTNISSWWVNGNCSMYRTTGGTASGQSPSYLTYVSGSCVAPGSSEVYKWQNSTVANSGCSTPGWNSMDMTVGYRCVGDSTTYYSSAWNSVGGHWNCATTNLVTDYNSHTFNIGRGSAPCYSNIVFTVHNSDSVAHYYALAGSMEIALGKSYNATGLNPGQTGTLTANGIPCADVAGYSVITLNTLKVGGDGGGDFMFWSPGDYENTAGTTAAYSPSSGGTSGSGGVDTGGSSPPQFDATSTNSPQIIWSSTNTDNSGTIAAVHDIGKALFDSSVKIGDQAHIDSLAETAAIQHIPTNVVASGGGGGVSNVWVQNFPTNTPFPTATFNGISNLLSANSIIPLSNFLSALQWSNAVAIAASSASLSNFLAQNNLNERTNDALLASGISNAIAILNTNEMQNLTGISNLLSSLSNSTNEDLATEMTQVGISNGIQNLIMWGSNDWTSLSLVNSNLVSLFSSNTNLYVGTNVAQEGTLSGMSNLLGSASEGVGTNVEAAYQAANDRLLGLIPGTATNYGSALAAATAATADERESVVDFIGSLTPVLPSANPSAPNMNVMIAGMTLDLDPVHEFPTVAAASLLGWTIILILAFLVEVSRLYWECVKVRATAQTGHVPNLEASGSFSILGCGGSIGGNAAGLAVSVGIPLLIIAAFTVAMKYLFENLGVDIAVAMNIQGWTNSLGAIGYYLLASFFPVSLAFSLLTTRLTLSFTMSHLVALASATLRFLIG